MRTQIVDRFIRTGLLLAAIALVGCGVKGPPVPPKSPPVPKVPELVHRLEDSAVILEWALAERLTGQQARRASFGIYRFRAKLSEPFCETCPLVFEKVDTVPYEDAQDGRFYRTVNLEGGFRYVFKVRMEIGGRAGGDSNLVRFDFSSN